MAAVLEYGYIFIVGSSMVFLFVVAVYAIKNIEVAGSKAFLFQIICVSIWSAGSLLEMLAPTEQLMLFWRNIQQIGIFLVPVACIYFAVDYAQYVKLKKYIPLLLIIPILAIILIFTDSTTHLMRTGYIVSYNSFFGKALSVQQTLLGKILVSNNYLLAFCSLVILYIFSRHVAKTLRRQVMLNFWAIGLIFILGFLKSAFLEGTDINIPIVTIYLPSSIILFYNLYRNGVFVVSPVAREKVFDVVEMGIIVTDRAGAIADVNPFALQLLDACFEISDAPNGKTMDSLFPNYPDWIALTRKNATGELELSLLSPCERYIYIRVFPLQSSNGVFLGSVSIMSDVTVVRRQELALKKRAETDNLTGLMNRGAFMSAFSSELEKSAAAGSHVSVLMMDLDKFKWINDTYGHGVGDRVLAEFADLLKCTLRQEDAVARIGGDEFAAMLRNTNREKAAEIANRIIQAANRTQIPLDDQTVIQLKLCIGICENQGAASAEEMLKCADQAMYCAKNGPGNSFAIWEQ